MSIRNVARGLRRWVTVCGLVSGGFCLAGCRTQPVSQQSTEVPPGVISGSPTSPTSAASPATDPVAGSAAAPVLTNSGGLRPQVLRVGDSLTVTFLDTPTAIPPFLEKIREDGTITLALNHSFVADGKTVGDLEKEIRAFYVPDYYKNLTVTVAPDVNTRWYYIDGEVRTPSRQVYTSRITVSKAIASAGGFTDFANKKKVKLVRVDGRSQIVNCPKVLADPSLDPEVYPGDKIHVPRRLW